MKILYHIIKRLFLFPLMLMIGGCVSSDISDLVQWTDEVMARPGGRIDPLPEIKPYEAYTYASGNLGAPDPFESFYQQRHTEVAEVDENAGLTKEMENELRNRNREELEQFELDSLRMVGIMEDENNKWGIISDPDGNVQFVKVGNYLGRNIGKIVNVFEDRIELREIIRNEQGRWEERPAAIALIETE